MSIKSIQVSGSFFEMGQQYGNAMKDELLGALETLKDYFITAHQIPYETMVAKSNLFVARYSFEYKGFLSGISSATNISIDDVNILNGMETLNSLVSSNEALSACAFLFVPPSHSATSSSIIGRNYDFPYPYSAIAVNLTITEISPINMLPVTIIALPGQIYCPSCVSSNGLFVELNNGMPSGGYTDALNRKSMLINMLEFLHNAENLESLQYQFSAAESDYSLIINTANTTTTQSYEYSATMGMMPFTPDEQHSFVSTNFFLNQTWGNKIPEPTDATTWLGVTRRDNLLNLTNQNVPLGVDDIKDIMNIKIEDGGAVWSMTIYQIVFDSSENQLYVTRPQLDNGMWFEV